MRKIVIMAALGCFAMATAADAQLVEVRHTECAYNLGDRDLVVEVARLDAPGLSALALA